MSTCALRDAELASASNGQCGDRMRDPSFPVAIRALERHPDYREAARICPDLALPETEALGVPAYCNIVLVHGGLSNGLACFGDNLIGGRSPLLQPRPGMNVFRFEHDTWLPVEDNVAQLVALVRQKLFGKKLLLIGFSRGGIVATRTAARLRELGAIACASEPQPRPRGTHADVRVMTFGTPHRGFRTGQVGLHFPRTCYFLQYLVSTAIRHLPLRRRVAIFIESFRRLSRLPPGIADMSPTNPELERFIRSEAGRWLEPRLNTYGGSPAQPAWLPDWCRALLSRPVPGIGDGAVSLRSATAYGRERREVRGCGHDDYFFRAEVRGAIAYSLAPLAALIVGGTPFPAAS